MLDLLYRVNTQTISNSKPMSLRSRTVRRLVRIVANFILPIIYSLSGHKKLCCDLSNNRLIVSITSYPARIKKVWIVIETIFRQTLRPSKIVLWLSQDQFPHKMASLPKRLLSQTSRGLEIHFIEGDIKSHKKYYYAFKAYEDSVIFLIDDDIFYPPSIIENTFSIMTASSHVVVANFGFRYSWDHTTNYISIHREPFLSLEKGNDLFFGSGGGTAFRPKDILDYLDSSETIMKLCPTADDIYLNSITRLAGLEICLLSNRPLITLFEKGSSLLSQNGKIGDIDSTNAMQMRSLINYLLHKYGINPFLV